MEAPAKRPVRASTWIDEELVKQAKVISTVSDETLSEVIERHLRQSLPVEYRRVIAAEALDLGNPIA